MEVNQAGVIPESDTNNNVAYVSVNLPPTDCASPPANNFFTNAVVIGSAPFTIQQFNACATKEPGEPNHAGNAGGHSLWYRWTPSVSQLASVNTKRSDFDTLLAVYTGSSVSTLSLVASNDDIVSDVYKQSELSFTATAGTTYWIAVDGWGGAVGTVVLNVNPPRNDDFADAYAISGAAGTTNGFNLNASKEPNEPAHAYDVGGHSVWYSWTAPTNGPVEFNTAGSTFSTILAVYTNSVLPTNLLAIASNAREGGGLLTSRVHFNASSGRTYHIALDGATGATGYYWISWNMLCHLSANLVPTNRIQINVTGVSSQRYQLQTSTNLADWIPLAHFTVVGDSISVLDNLRPGPAFYRAVGLP
jgi:hypothetical protein